MTCATVTLRDAGAADAARIAELYLASRAAFTPYAKLAHSDEAVRAWISDILLPREAVTVASVGEVIAGFLAIHRTDGVSWISQLYLDPPCVGRGIGSRLLAHALAKVTRPIRLYTFQRNAEARRFYERNGFAPIRFGDGTRNEEQCPDVLYELA